MATATTKLSLDAIIYALGIPADVSVRVAHDQPESDALTLIVSHDSIPEGANEVVTMIRQEIYEHSYLRFGHFAAPDNIPNDGGAAVVGELSS